eukprot:4979337-Ditylum_brightwellii.AAC.1
MVEDKGLESEVADKIGTFIVKKVKPWTLYNELMGNGYVSKWAFDTHASANETMEDWLCMLGNMQIDSIGGGGHYDNLVSMFQEAGK